MHTVTIPAYVYWLLIVVTVFVLGWAALWLLTLTLEWRVRNMRRERERPVASRKSTFAPDAGPAWRGKSAKRAVEKT